MTDTVHSMAVGEFAGIPNTDVPVGTDRIVARNGAGYIYDAAIDTAYVTAHPRTAAITHNGRGFRLDPLQRLTIEMFGGVADGTRRSSVFGGDVIGTDNADAIDAAIDYVRNTIVDVEWPFSPTIHFGATGVYDTSRTIQPYGAMHIVGEQASIFAGTVIRFPADTCGVLINQRNTARDGGGFGGPYTSAAGSIIENIHFASVGSTPSIDSKAHGFWGRALATVRGCTFDGFAGSGMAWIGGSDRSDFDYGTPNGFFSEQNTIVNCGGRAGFYAAGYDCNGGTSICDVVKDSHSAGFIDVSALGNTYVNPNVHGSAQVNGAGQNNSRCHYQGYQWHCSTYEVTGIAPALGSKFWIRVGAQTAPSPYWPAWNADTTYRFEGAIYVGGQSNQTTILGFYSESLITSTHDSAAVVIGGNAYGTAGTNNLAVVGGLLSGISGIGSYQRWAGLSQTQQSYLGDVSTVHIGAAPNGTYSHLQHYDAKEDRTYAYYPDTRGDHVYANSLDGYGGEPIYRVTGRYTQKAFGRGQPQTAVFNPAKLAIADPQFFDGSGDRIVRYGSELPTVAGGFGERVYNNGSNTANDAIEYWVMRRAGWQARP